jgi:hypothetical protein
MPWANKFKVLNPQTGSLSIRIRRQQVVMAASSILSQVWHNKFGMWRPQGDRNGDPLLRQTNHIGKLKTRKTENVKTEKSKN